MILKPMAGPKGWNLTIQIDAGDFSEGSVDYYRLLRLHSFKIMELMNYDAIATVQRSPIGFRKNLTHHSAREDRTWLPHCGLTYQ